MPSTRRQRSTLLALVTGAALLLGACGGSDEQPPATAAPATTTAPATTAAGSDTGAVSGGGATSGGGGTTGSATLEVKGDAKGAVTALLGAWKHEDEELAYGYGTQGAVGSLFAQPTPAYVALLGCDPGRGKDEMTCEATTGGPSSGTKGDERGITLRTTLLPDGDTGNAFWTVTKATVGAPGTGGVPAGGSTDVPYEVIR
jgi:hypothetical protein